MAFYVITDSASDVPESVIKEYDLHVIPTPVTIDGKDYFDGSTIFPDTFYAWQEQGKEISTYHISELMFYDNFKPYAERGDEVLYICFSTGIAGTFQAANLAKTDLLEEFPEFQLTIIDSKCASIGYGLVVSRLLQMQKNGAPKELIIEAAKYFCAHMKHVVTVETLDYLYKGGRLSRTSAVLGGVLDIKPIIFVNEEGALQAVDKVRGWKRALKHIVNLTEEMGADLTNQVVGICHGNTKESFDLVKDMLLEQLHVKGVLETRVGCAIGAHTGPGIVAIVFLDELNPEYEKYINE